MTHRTVVNCETKTQTHPTHTAEEQAIHHAAVAAQAEAEAAAVVVPTEPVVTPTEPAA